MANLKQQLEQKKQKLIVLSYQVVTAQETFKDCDDSLQGMGAKKRGKSPEMVEEIQSKINQLRAKKASAKTEYNALQKELTLLSKEITKLEAKIARTEELDAQQSERDRFANPQSNNTGRTPNQQRKIGWF